MKRSLDSLFMPIRKNVQCVVDLFFRFLCGILGSKWKFLKL